MTPPRPLVEHPATTTCQRCGRPAYPHPYRHPVSIARPPAPPPPPPPPMPAGDLLTVAEVAARMRVSVMTVYRLVHVGEMTAYRFGRSYRIHPDHLAAYLAAATKKGTP